MTPNLDIMLCSLPPAEASNVFHNEVVEDHQIERSLLYREMVILLAIALFVAIRAVIL